VSRLAGRWRRRGHLTFRTGSISFFVRYSGTSPLFRFPFPRCIDQAATELRNRIRPLGGTRLTSGRSTGRIERRPGRLAPLRDPVTRRPHLISCPHLFVRAKPGLAGRLHLLARRLGLSDRALRCLFLLLLLSAGRTERTGDHEEHDQQEQQIRESLHLTSRRRS
jgi:hypothetical protein